MKLEQADEKSLLDVTVTYKELPDRSVDKNAECANIPIKNLHITRAHHANPHLLKIALISPIRWPVSEP